MKLLTRSVNKCTNNSTFICDFQECYSIYNTRINKTISSRFLSVSNDYSHLSNQSFNVIIPEILTLLDHYSTWIIYKNILCTFCQKKSFSETISKLTIVYSHSLCYCYMFNSQYLTQKPVLPKKSKTHIIHRKKNTVMSPYFAWPLAHLSSKKIILYTFW